MKRLAGAMLAAAALILGPGGAAAEDTKLLVDPAWLQARLGDPGIRIVDMVTEPEAYQQAHVPGAVYLNVNDARVAVPAGGFRLPTAEEGARLLGSLGIRPDTLVVIYDDSGGLHASRLFFTLDVLGHDRAALLDGGIQAWRRGGRPVTREIPKVAPTTYRPVVRAERVASAEWIKERLGDPGTVLVDARSPAEYEGRDVRARRGGHIPGAVNIPWSQAVREDGTFKSAEELEALYQGKGITPDKEVIAYCRIGERSSHTWFVLKELLGYPRVRNYDGSWTEWGSMVNMPIERP